MWKENSIIYYLQKQNDIDKECFSDIYYRSNVEKLKHLSYHYGKYLGGLASMTYFHCDDNMDFNDDSYEDRTKFENYLIHSFTMTLSAINFLKITGYEIFNYDNINKYIENKNKDDIWGLTINEYIEKYNGFRGFGNIILNRYYNNLEDNDAKFLCIMHYGRITRQLFRFCDHHDHGQNYDFNILKSVILEMFHFLLSSFKMFNIDINKKIWWKEKETLTDMTENSWNNI